MVTIFSDLHRANECGKLEKCKFTTKFYVLFLSMKMSFQCFPYFLRCCLCCKLKLFVPEESFVYDTGRISTSKRRRQRWFHFLWHVNNGVLIPLARVSFASTAALSALHWSNKYFTRTWKLAQTFVCFSLKKTRIHMRFSSCLSIRTHQGLISVCSNLFVALRCEWKEERKVF